MSFFDKIVKNKAVAATLALGTALVAGSIYLYSSYKNEGKEAQQQKDDLSLQKQILSLKSQINTNNLSIDDVKRILQFSMSFAKKKIVLYNKEFKKKRQQYNNKTRKQNMKEYMNLISDCMQEVRNIATNTQSEIMKDLALTESAFIKYQSQLGMFMQQLMIRETKGAKKLTLQQVKYAVRLQTQYLKNQGQQILDLMIQATQGWPTNKKSQLPLLLSIVVADGTFQEYPQLEEQALQEAEMQMQHQITAQLTQLQQVMMPLMAKLSSGLGGMGGMGGMGGFDMQGLGEQEMHQHQAQLHKQLQQLQRLRQQNPAAFQQMLGNIMNR